MTIPPLFMCRWPEPKPSFSQQFVCLSVCGHISCTKTSTASKPGRNHISAFFLTVEFYCRLKTKTTGLILLFHVYSVGSLYRIINPNFFFTCKLLFGNSLCGVGSVLSSLIKPICSRPVFPLTSKMCCIPVAA